MSCTLLSFIFFFLMIRRPPRSTLFPYTTLFRSRDGTIEDKHHSYVAPSGLRVNHWALAGDWTIGRQSIVLNKPEGRIVYQFHAREDRKSTRLNSSHANISYAVFCLKKKKKILNRILIVIHQFGHRSTSHLHPSLIIDTAKSIIHDH